MDATVGGTKLVGQRHALSLIESWKHNNTFPHFLLIAGDVGSGKKTMCYLIAQTIGCNVYKVEDISANSVRDVIMSAYSTYSPIIYLFPDADKMSAAAKNSLLKLTEEPPDNAYIVITLQSLDNTLGTLRSRSQHIVMEEYSFDELKLLSDDDRLCKLAKTPGMLKRLMAMDKSTIDKIVDTSDKLIRYIDKVSFPNSLKSANSIKFKEADKGIEIDLFIAGLSYVLTNMINDVIITADKEMLFRLSCWTRALCKYGSKFSYIGVNKKALYDMFILEVRNSLRGGAGHGFGGT